MKLHVSLLFAVALFFLSSCSQKNADPNQIAEAKKLISEKSFDKGINSCDLLYQNHPMDPEVKKTCTEAYMTYANHLLTDSLADRKTKYRTALKMYRKVVQIDSTNSDAKNNILLIESIYQQMGRPVPTE